MASPRIREKLRHLPAEPGVYLFRDAEGDILYIGKANSLRARVRSYFGSGRDESLKTRELRKRIADFESIVVGSEAEALVLEANLIKEHRPRFNIRHRDDKRYPYIKVTVQEPFPRVFVTRRLESDGARYFGPYTDVGPMRHALEVIKRLYTVRSCRYDLPGEAPARPCLDYHIGRCKAPCVGLQSSEDYREMTDEILDVLGGRTGAVRRRTEDAMADASEALDFERAAELRDVLKGLDAIERRQRAIDLRGGDQDVVGLARDGDRAYGVLLRVREGKLLGHDVWSLENLGEEDDDAVLSALVSGFYIGRGEDGLADLPREVFFPFEFPDREPTERLLEQAAGRRVRTHVPQRGAKRRLVDLANQNARHLLEEQVVLSREADTRAETVLYELQDALDLKVVPRRIVCFDISHNQGTEVVGSAVMFENGEPRKSEYRRFRVRGDWGNDDYRSMKEVVGRYFARRVDEGGDLPELAVIDGGKGQLTAALAALDTLEDRSVADMTVCSIAKREEEIYLADRPDPIRLPRTSPALRLLQRARDEAHRFAHGYNRGLRKRRTLVSELGEIPGVGPVRQRALLEEFGSVRALREAAPDDIARVRGFSEALAGRIKNHLSTSGAA